MVLDGKIKDVEGVDGVVWDRGAGGGGGARWWEKGLGLEKDNTNLTYIGKHCTCVEVPI